MRLPLLVYGILYLSLAIICGVSIFSCSYFGAREWAEEVLEWPNGTCTYLNKTLDDNTTGEDWYNVWFTVEWNNGSVPTTSIAKSYLVYSHDEVYVSFVEACVIDPETMEKKLLRVYAEDYLLDIVDTYTNSIPWIITVMVVVFSLGFCFAVLLPALIETFRNKKRKLLSADEFIGTINEKYWETSLQVLFAKLEEPISEYNDAKSVRAAPLRFIVAEAEDTSVFLETNTLESSRIGDLDSIPDEAQKRIIRWFYENKEKTIRDALAQAIEHYEPSKENFKTNVWDVTTGEDEPEADKVTRTRNNTKSQQNSVIFSFIALSCIILVIFIFFGIISGFLCWVMTIVHEIGSSIIAISFQVASFAALGICALIICLYGYEKMLYMVYLPAQRLYGGGYPNSYRIGVSDGDSIDCVIFFNHQYSVFTLRYELKVEIVELPSNEKVWIVEVFVRDLPYPLLKYLSRNSVALKPNTIEESTVQASDKDFKDKFELN